MPDFQVVGTGRETGRRRKRVFQARDEQEARLLAEKDGTLVDEIVELPPEPPTDNQLTFAGTLGIDIPPQATGQEVSDLISLHTWKDKVSSPQLRKLAYEYGAALTRYSGKKLLFQRIFSKLSEAGNEENLAAWFTYRVYREQVHGNPDARISSPKDEAIKTIAQHLAKDASVIQSIRRYSGEDLVWFGQWTSPSGMVHEGGSNRTTAYKKASEQLKALVAAEKRVEIIEAGRRQKDRTISPTFSTADPLQPSKGGGCFAVIVIGFSVVALTAKGISMLA